MNEHTELATTQQGHIERALTSQQLVARDRIIRETMELVMQNGLHYGKIPGCGDKPALLKPGAEKLAATFGIAIEPIPSDLSGHDEVRYRVETRATSMASGAYLGSGTGECSSSEEKYHWKKSASPKEFDATPEDRKRIKYGSSYDTKQVRTNPADVANTILKMATKRSKVDLILTVLGCSDMFEQDIDDDDVAALAKEQRTEAEPLKQPQAKAKTEPAKTTAAMPSDAVLIVGVDANEGVSKAGKPYIKYVIQDETGTEYSTFDKKLAAVAAECLEKTIAVVIEAKATQYGNDLVNLRLAEAVGA